ncbi:MAG: endonuclease, partial [Bacteroidaceae bacterium]|nr:endonuclease [Bacteroidaceae bacterium]
MKRLLTASLLLCLALLAQAQQKDYYHKVQGLKKAELKTALFNLIQPTSVPKYGGKGEGYTWWGFTLTDRMPDGTVRDRYSANQYKFDGLEAVNGMNIEHSFANSWWGHIVNNAYCDLFNLYPSDSEANGRKSNNPIGVVDGAVAYDNGVTRVGRSSSYRPDSLITVWEPADNWKGDFARTFFYMATCYEDYTDLWQTTEGLLMVEKNRYPTLRPWIATLLMQWNRQDPVDDIERERNA